MRSDATTAGQPQVHERHLSHALRACIALCSVWTGAMAFPGGSGTAGDPWHIASAADLDSVRHHLSSHFIMVNDVDIGPYSAAKWGDSGWLPLGNPVNAFEGSFDGDGKTVCGLFVRRPLTSAVGLFSYIRGTVTRLGVHIAPEDSVAANSSVGGLAGRNDGTVSFCYVKGGMVRGAASVGCLVGYNYEGVIANCYAAAVDSGSSSLGGLVGTNYGVVDTCYAASTVYAPATAFDGGLAGTNHGAITECYWNSTTSIATAGIGGGTNLAGTTGRTSAQMRLPASFAGWDTTVWLLTTSSFPTLKANPQFPAPGALLTRGAGTSADPYLISNAGDLDILRNYVYSGTPPSVRPHFRITQDIDLTAYLAPGGRGFAQWGSRGWRPVGGSVKLGIIPALSGTVDGNNKTISGLWIHRTTSYVGLIGNLSSARIDDLRVSVAAGDTVRGASNVGVLFGTGSIDTLFHCATAGAVKGVDLVGGFAGALGINCFPIRCRADCAVSGRYRVGGFCGTNILGIPVDCYATGTVTASDSAGGFIGYAMSTVNRSYSTGLVTSSGLSVGGFAGVSGSTAADNCYWDTQTSTRTTSPSANGRTTAQMKQTATFVNWDFTAVWDINPAINNGYPYLRGTLAQAITLDTASRAVSDADFLPATASSGLAVTFVSSDSTVASIVGGKVHPLKAGTTTITVSQAGNQLYSAAPTVSYLLTVRPSGGTHAIAAGAPVQRSEIVARRVQGATVIDVRCASPYAVRVIALDGRIATSLSGAGTNSHPVRLPRGVYWLVVEVDTQISRTRLTVW